MLAGTKKIFPTEYELFVDSMCDAAEDDKLPVGLSYKDDKVKDLSLQDIHDLMYDFYNDTGLDLRAMFFMCSECGQLHLLLKVDWPDEFNDIPVQ